MWSALGPALALSGPENSKSKTIASNVDICATFLPNLIGSDNKRRCATLRTLLAQQPFSPFGLAIIIVAYHVCEFVFS